MENISTKPTHKIYDIYTSEEERHEAKKARMLKCYYERRDNMLAERELNDILPKKGGRPRKYNTEQERLSAKRQNQKRYMVRKRLSS